MKKYTATVTTIHNDSATLTIQNRECTVPLAFLPGQPRIGDTIAVTLSAPSESGALTPDEAKAVVNELLS